MNVNEIRKEILRLIDVYDKYMYMNKEKSMLLIEKMIDIKQKELRDIL